MKNISNVVGEGGDPVSVGPAKAGILSIFLQI